MSITERDHNKIANKVYEVDSGKTDSPVVAGDKILNKKFQVLKVKDNTANGMQAMAVAPVDKSGKVDYSRVVIAYAGTNSRDALDLLTDAQQIGLGNETLIIPTLGGLTEELNTQVDTAMEFAEKVEKEVKKKNPHAVITSTGHSLGESLSMYVSLKRGYANVGYNGPDIHSMISDKELKYMKEHPEQFINYRHKYDKIGNITGNKTGVARYPKVYEGKDKLSKFIDYHLLSGWEFTKDGKLKDRDGEIASSSYSLTHLQGQFSAAMHSLKSMKTTLSKGGYSSSEKIYLDSTQSSVAVTAMADTARSGADIIKSWHDKALTESMAILDERDFSGFSELSYDELVSIYASKGIDEASITALVAENFEADTTQSAALATGFETLESEVQTGIQAMLAADSGLANDFKSWTVSLSGY